MTVRCVSTFQIRYTVCTVCTLTAHGILEVYLKYATSMPSTRTWVSICILESYWNVPPHTDFSVCSPARSKYASSILQVYLGRAGEYTRAVLGEVRDKYILGEVYFRNYSPSTLQGVFAKYTSRSLRQVRVKESSPSILQGVFAKYASRSLRQVRFKESSPSILQAYSIKYAPSTLTVVCIMLSYKSCID